MVNINIICIGKLKEDYLRLAQNEYIKRLSAFCKLSIVELNEYKLPAKPSQTEIDTCIAKEGESIMQRVKGMLIPLCIEGTPLSSEQLSEKLTVFTVSGISEITFVIGGSYGLSNEVKEKSELKLSMSKMTFPHQLARVMLLEQVYRAFQISTNGKYHK